MKKGLLLFYIFIYLSALFSKNIHPAFNIDKNDLLSVTADLESSNAIIGDSYNFLEIIDNLLKYNKANLEMVDKNHRLSGEYVPENMVNLHDYPLTTRYKKMLFVEYAVDDFIKMSRDAEQLGLELFIASTYRSYDFQDQIFTNMKNYHGEEKAATIVAYPGASQHQLGTAVDFGTITPSYANTEAGKWLNENSWKYGFTISYPRGMQELTSYMWEPWHFRYIGKEAAIIQKEYFSDIQHNFLQFWKNHREFFIENHIQ